MSRGWTLHEMLISLAVTAGIFVLASNAALGHLRFFRGTGEIVRLRSQLGHASGIAAGVLRAVDAPPDILLAQDSAAEVYAAYGVAFACKDDTGRATFPAPSSDPPGTLAAFGDTPQPGDVARILFVDDSGAGWIAARVAAAPMSGGPCARFPAAASTWTVSLVEPFVVPAGAALRFARRTRVSSYRASDGRWYLGVREWNGTLERFNTVQPVAGPLRPYGLDAASTGFLLAWTDSAGAPAGADPNGIAAVTVVARGESVRPVRVAGLWSRAAPWYADSSVSAVPFRNRR